MDRMTPHAALIHEHLTLLAAHRQEVHRLKVAYGWREPLACVAPLETPSAAWLAQRERVEQQCSVRLRRFFVVAGATS